MRQHAFVTARTRPCRRRRHIPAVVISATGDEGKPASAILTARSRGYRAYAAVLEIKVETTAPAAPS